MRLIFNISNHCNLQCKYCFQHKNKSTILKMSDAKLLIDELIKIILNKPSKLDILFPNKNDIENEIFFDFIGGEPTLYLDLINDICNYFYEECIHNSIIDWYNKAFKIIIETNGTTYDTSEMQSFIEKYKDRIDLPISVDGCKECHDKCRVFANEKGSYDLVEKAIKMHFKQFNKEPNSKLTFSIDNMKYLKESVENLYNLGYTRIRMSFDCMHMMSKTECEMYYNELRRVIDYIVDNKIKINILSLTRNDFNPKFTVASCGSDGRQLAIDWDGNLYPCEKFGSIYLGKKYHPIGNVRDGITDFEFIEILRNGGRCLNGPCGQCPIRKSCGSCPATNILVNDDMCQTFGLCGENVAEAKAQLYFIKRAKETDYPYFKDKFEMIQNYYDPNYEYVVDTIQEGYKI